MNQLTFTDAEDSNRKYKTRKQKFLEKMDALIPWDQLEGKIAPFYPKSGGGRRPYPFKVMLRVHCLQLFYNLSDPAMQDSLHEIAAMRHFVGLRSCDSVPEETTILNFRHLLEKHNLGKVILEEVNKLLDSPTPAPPRTIHYNPQKHGRLRSTPGESRQTHGYPMVSPENTPESRILRCFQASNYVGIQRYNPRIE